MSLIKKYVIKNKGAYFLSILCAILGVIMQLISYIILAEMITNLLSDHRDMGFYGKKLIMILFAFFLKEIFAGISTVISHSTTFRTLRDIRIEIADKLFKMPLGDIHNMNSGRLKDIIVDQVDHMETTMAHIIPEVTANIVGPILFIIYMLLLDWRLAILSLIPLIVGVLALNSVMGEDYQEKVREAVTIGQNMNHAIVEYVNGVEVIKAFNQSDISYKKYHDAVYDNASFYYHWMKESMIYTSIGRVISPMGLIVIIPLGIFFYLKGSLEIVPWITIIILSFGTVENIIKVTNYVDDISRIQSITNEIEEIINNRELVHEDSGKEMQGNRIRFEDVNFSYEKDKKVLDQMNLEIPEHKFTAFVGPSGGGKSTLIRLIAGFWDPDSGRITIGNVNLKEMSLERLSHVVSYVSQDNFLFDKNVRENIRVGNPMATDEEVEEIARLSGCDAFIRELAHGYDTVVGEGGSHLSGGERQRISIARAMLKDAPIVILDEATSYIDPENESIIQEAINHLAKDKTLIMVAHRLRTIVDADQIVVIDQGHIENIGTHEELLKISPIYHDMWEAAIKGDEA